MIELVKSIINILKGWGLRVKVRVEAKKGSGVWKKRQSLGNGFVGTDGVLL